MAKKSKKAQKIKVTKLSVVDEQLRKTPTPKKAKVEEAPQPTEELGNKQFRHWNFFVSLVLIAQAITLTIYAQSQSLAITSNFLNTDSLASQSSKRVVLAPAVRRVFELDLKVVVIIFLLSSAFFHLLIATYSRKKTDDDIKHGVNRLRWIDYGLTSGLMFVAISLINGVYDLATMVLIFALVLSLHLYGYQLEMQKLSGVKVTYHNLVGLLGSGGAIWLAIAIYLKNSIIYGHVAGNYVYYIDGSIFIVTLALATNAYLSYKSHGPWQRYFFTEKVYILLSLVAKSALAWQIYYGLLR